MLYITHFVELSNYTLYFLCQVNKQQTDGTSCAAFDYAVTLKSLLRNSHMDIDSYLVASSY